MSKELWIDLVKTAMAGGENDVDAIESANIIVDAYEERFGDKQYPPCCVEEETGVCWGGEAKRSPYREVCSSDARCIIEVNDDDDEDEEWVERVFVGFYFSDEREVAYACHDALQAGLVQLWDNARIRV